MKMNKFFPTERGFPSEIKLIELWKNDCEDCEATKPVVEQLEKQGFEFEKINVSSDKINDLWREYHKEINAFSKKNGWEENIIYTPTFINPTTSDVLAFADGVPSREDLILLANIK